jgi:hypothetical protein
MERKKISDENTIQFDLGEITSIQIQTIKTIEQII